MRGSCEGNSPSEREPFGIALFDRRHRLAGHPGEGGDLSFQGERLSRVSAVLQRVPVASKSPASGSMHPANSDPRTAALGTVARCVSISRGLSMPGA